VHASHGTLHRFFEAHACRLLEVLPGRRVAERRRVLEDVAEAHGLDAHARLEVEAFEAAGGPGRHRIDGELAGVVGRASRWIREDLEGARRLAVALGRDRVARLTAGCSARESLCQARRISAPPAARLTPSRS
jgi:hypothetical protein